jgi:hypothetical protein
MKYIFICVDAQEDYFTGTYRSMTNVIRPGIQKLFETSNKLGIKVIYTRGWYPNNLKEFSETPDFINTFPKRCLMNSNGAELIQELRGNDPLLIDWGNKTGLNFPEIHQKSSIIVNKERLYKNEGIKKGYMSPFDGNPYFMSLIHNMGTVLGEKPTFIIYGVNIGPTVSSILMSGYEVMVVDDVNVNFNGVKLTKNEIIPDMTVERKENMGILGESMTGMEYPSRDDDGKLKFVTLKELIGE